MFIEKQKLYYEIEILLEEPTNQVINFILARLILSFRSD